MAEEAPVAEQAVRRVRAGNPSRGYHSTRVGREPPAGELYLEFL